jgi:hypothetical protein
MFEEVEREGRGEGDILEKFEWKEESDCEGFSCFYRRDHVNFGGRRV